MPELWSTESVIYALIVAVWALSVVAAIEWDRAHRARKMTEWVDSVLAHDDMRMVHLNLIKVTGPCEDEDCPCWEEGYFARQRAEAESYGRV